MGGQRAYVNSGGFNEYLYHQVGETVTANGVSGKVVEKIGDDRLHSGLPKYSNTSKVYLKTDDRQGIVEQARVYDNRTAALDFDWGHTHCEYRKGIVHVHEWRKDKNGKLIRSGKPRLMNNAEMEKYGDLLKKANPDVKFRE